LNIRDRVPELRRDFESEVPDLKSPGEKWGLGGAFRVGAGNTVLATSTMFLAGIVLLVKGIKLSVSPNGADENNFPVYRHIRTMIKLLSGDAELEPGAGGIQMPDIELKRMLEQEIGDVVSLIARAMNETEGKWADKTIKFHFFCEKHGQDDGRAYFTAHLDGKIAGIIGLHRYIWGPQDTAWLGWFAVDPDFHGQKIGYNLMNEVIKHARNSGYRRLLVETYSDEDFEKARKFYERYGFKVVGNINDYIRDGVNMVVFGLDLT